MGAATNASNRCIDREATGFCHPAGHEGEGPPGHSEQRRMRDAIGVADEIVQRQARAGGQVEHSAVDEANSDAAVGHRLDHVTLANGITDRDLNGNAARTPYGAAADRRLNIANDLGKQGRNGLTVVTGLNAERNRHWLRPRLLSSAWCRRLCFAVACAPRSTVLAPAAPGLPAETPDLKTTGLSRKESRPATGNSIDTVAGAALPNQK